MRRTFILHASGAKLPTDLLGLTSIRYDEATAAEMRVVCQKLGRRSRTRAPRPHRGPVVAVLPHGAQPARAVRVSLLRISRDRDGAPGGDRRSWQEDGNCPPSTGARREGEERAFGRLLLLEGERPLDPNAPQLDGTGEIRLEAADRAAGYWTTRRTDPRR
jgi:hypothetical protein